MIFLVLIPKLLLTKKSNSPDEDKSVYDTRLLIPTLSDFFKKHPLINPKTFIGDAAFILLKYTGIYLQIMFSIITENLLQHIFH